MTDATDFSSNQPPRKPDFKCSFCGKTQTQVRKLIAGPDVFICDECVGMCAEICEEEEGDVTDADVVAHVLPLITGHALAAREADDRLAKWVNVARRKGAGWETIAEALGMTSTEAELRFSSEKGG